MNNPGRKPSLAFDRRIHVMLPPENTIASMRLEFCAEHTKPAYLRIRLLGTPQNHRSPPA